MITANFKIQAGLHFALSMLFLIAQTSVVDAQLASPPNRVLELGGNYSYVELPQNIFNNLTEATVEGWVKWGKISAAMKVFEFGRPGQSMRLALANGVDRDLRFAIGALSQPDQTLDVLNIIPNEEWFHFAAVSGRGGMRLYFNGSLVASNAFTGSMATLRNDDRNSFGLGLDSGDQPVCFDGQLGEMRVWKTARTEPQIRDGMFRRLTGKEEGLVGLWNFEEGGANDSSSNAYHGQLMGRAKVIEAQLPTVQELSRTASLSGTITDANGTVLTNASIVLELSGSVIAQTGNDADGAFVIALDPNSGPYELSVTAGDLGARLTGLRIQPSEQKKMDFKLQPAVSISGSVQTLDNSPQALVVVQVVEAVPASAGVPPASPGVSPGETTPLRNRSGREAPSANRSSLPVRETRTGAAGRQAGRPPAGQARSENRSMVPRGRRLGQHRHPPLSQWRFARHKFRHSHFPRNWGDWPGTHWRPRRRV